MLKASLFFLGLIALSIAATEFEVKQQFAEYKLKFNKSYTDKEHETRFANFKASLERIATLQAREKGTATYGLTKFSDLSPAEFRSRYLMPSFNKAQLPVANVSIITPLATLPSTFDWNSKGAITPVKNQGQCGDCWAFSTTGSVEGIHEISSGNLVSLSEQNLCDCSTSNQGCNGGLMDQAFQYIIANKGIDTEEAYPYTATQGTCNFKAANVGATISNYTDVQSGDEAALALAANKQPISVAIDASHVSFQLYSSGVYHELFCSATKLDHGVLVVGYGTDSEKKAYWIVKNSWGASWGLQGYIMMSRDRNNNCGIATSASFPIV